MFDFYSFHNKGGFQLSYSSFWYQKTLNYILNKEKFNLAFNDKIPVENSIWDCPFEKKNNPPLVYRRFIFEFLNSSVMKHYQDVHGNFTFVKPMLHRTPKGYVNLFHGHIYDETDLHILFHFSREERTLEDGGLIELGVVVDKYNVFIDRNDFYKNSPKKHIVTLSSLCNNNLVTIINNKNPYFRHQVTEVVTSKERYTLMVACGYGSFKKIKNKVISYI